MAFEMIECVKPAYISGLKVPADGVRLLPRKLVRARGQARCAIRYIALKIGAQLARGITLTQPEHRLKLLFGTGEDAGQVMVAVDNVEGKFRARRDKAGNYVTSINAGTADGLFALEFPAFTIAGIAAHRPQGLPAHFVFQASKEMLAVAED